MESVEILNIERFKVFMQGLLSGRLKKTSFEPWEITLLLDLGTCPVVPGRRQAWLERYRDAMLSKFQRGFRQFPTITEFILVERRARSRRATVATITATPSETDTIAAFNVGMESARSSVCAYGNG
jgi:hypothetical protein